MLPCGKYPFVSAQKKQQGSSVGSSSARRSKFELVYSEPVCRKIFFFTDAMRIFRGCVIGLFALHRNGAVHRDIKPANILISVTKDCKFTPKIADFGLAKVPWFSFCKMIEQNDVLMFIVFI